VDDAALSRFIDGRDEFADLFRIWLRRGSGTLLHSPKAGQDTAITECAARHLARAFGGGFRVGHRFRFDL